MEKRAGINPDPNNRTLIAMSSQRDRQTGEQEVPSCANPRQLVEIAVAHAREGRSAEAIEQFRRAIQLDPNYPAAHHNLAVALAEQGQVADAITSFTEAIRIAPDYFEAHLNLANTLAMANRKAEAIDHYRHALALRPDSAEGLNGLGLTLTEMRRWDEAVVYLRQAVRLRPDFAEAHNSLGLALNDLAKWREAEAAFENALRLKPRYVEAHTNLGSCYAHQGRLTEALAAYDVALWLAPEQVSTHWNRSLSLLQLGDYENGWKEYEWRWRRTKSPMRPLPRPMWDGSSLEGNTILIWSEQGLGDTVQFSRYVPLVKEKGGTVALECPSPLLKLMARFGGVDQLVPEGQPLPPFDCHVPLMSLPRLFATRLESVPAPKSYITAQADRVERWREAMQSTDGLKIGLAWQGNPHHQWDRHRSLPLKQLAPLAELANVRLYSLQRGPGVEQIAGVSGKIRIVDLLDPAWTDAEAWAEVAAIMVNLDLVITVDTATAHVAGALGVRTWGLLAALCDWRWLQGREDTPWYPAMRLFRQDRLGEWAPVIERVAKEVVGLRGTSSADWKSE